MANNLVNIADKIMARGLLAMRGTNAFSRYVNRSYDVEAAEIGSTIDIPIASAVPARDVTPAQTPPATQDSAPTKAQITFDFHKEAPFHLTEKEMREVDVNGSFVPLQTSEAVKSLINAWNAYLANKAKLGFFNASGTAGTTPFATTLTAYNDARRLLNIELAPTDARAVILDPFAESNAMGLPQFTQADQRGDQDGIINGVIGHKLGADWAMDQQLATHTAGVQGGTPTGSGSAGSQNVTIASGGASGTYLAGDLVSFAGHNQTYVVTANVTLNGSGAGTIVVFPALRATISTALVTQRATHMNNFVMHRDAISAAIRVLPPAPSELGVISRTAIDPVTGMPLRLTLKLRHYQMEWTFDLLGGATVSRPEWGVRLLG